MNLKKIFSDKETTKTLVVSALIPIIVALIAVAPQLIKDFQEAPQYAIENTSLQPNENIIIIANNKAAKKKSQLDIEFDGIEYLKKGIPDEKEEGKWRFNLNDVHIMDKNEHQIRIRSPGDSWYSSIKIVITKTITNPNMNSINLVNNELKKNKIDKIKTTNLTVKQKDNKIEISENPVYIASKEISKIETSRRYTNKNEMIIDNTSKLMWLKNSSGSMNWHEAVNYLNKMNSKKMKGYNNWRLPNKQELLSVAKFAKMNPGFFPEDNQWYWSSTTKGLLFATAINMGHAEIEWDDFDSEIREQEDKKKDNYHVRLVRNNN